MRCFVSRIISIVASAIEAPVLATLESVLLETALAPLDRALGGLGTEILQPFAQEVARQMAAPR